MHELDFFSAAGPLTIAVVAAAGHSLVPADVEPSRLFEGVAALDRAGRNDVTAFIGHEGVDELRYTRAGACFVTQPDLALVPQNTIALVCREPGPALNRVATLFYPHARSPVPTSRVGGIDADATVHGAARLEAGVVVDSGVVIGPGAEIGAGTTIGAHSVIGAGVRIGRDSAIDPHVSISNALIGDRVVIHAGARIGIGGPATDARVAPRDVRLGRVLIQDDVEIGANVVIVRGAYSDTTIAEGSRIAPLVVVPGGTTTARQASLDALSFPRI